MDRFSDGQHGSDIPPSMDPGRRFNPAGSIGRLTEVKGALLTTPN